MNGPNFPQIHAKIAELIHRDHLREAESLCRQVLQGNPNDAVAVMYLGMIASRAGHGAPAVEMLRRSIALDPARAEAHFNLGLVYMSAGDHRQAEEAFREALRLQSDFAGARVNLGAVLVQLGRLPEAEAEFRAAVALRPQDPTLHINLGRVCRWQQRLGEAIACYQKAIAVAPNFAGTYSALGSSLREAGRVHEAVDAFRQAVALQPTFREAHSNLVYAMHFDPDTSLQENFAEHLRWAKNFAEPLKDTIRPYANDRDPNRRLRIGYVSPDLMNHVVGSFMEPILEHHDRSNVEVFCYADVPNPDDLSRRLQAHTDVWRQTPGLPDDQLAELIRQDRIDVLIDLTLHMRRSRLTMFARKPAPVQITHLGYCATTGVRAMDWCVSDPFMSPPGLNERWFTEKLLRLPESYWCYRPSATSPSVGPPAAAARGHVTFGSLNSFAKTNDRVIALWAKVLEAVPDSRLAVHASMGDQNAAARAMFTRAGIAPERLTLHGKAQRDDYLNLYNGIDIALDPIPYGGGTTSLDALWMGVPLVTLAGTTALSRTGVTLLSNLGLEDLIAQTPEQYVEIAARLATDLQRLTALKNDLRGRLSGSVLMDAPRYVKNLEAAYRHAWREWVTKP